MRAHLHGQASEIAQAINPELAGQLTFTSADEGTPAFERLREQMVAYGRLLPLRGIYSLALRDGHIVFGPENYPPDDPQASPPGTVYERPSPGDWEVFQTGKPTMIGPQEDEYGTFLSAVIPVLDPRTGEVLMAVGVDVEADHWQAQVNGARWGPGIGALGLMLVLLAGVRAVEWRRRLPVERQPRLRHIETALVGAFGVFLTVGLTLVVLESENRERGWVFDRLSGAKAGVIRDTFRDIQTGVDNIARFYDGSRHVRREEFSTFTRPMLRSAVVQAYAWIPVVTAEERKRAEAQAQADGHPEFVIWERNTRGQRIPATERATYYPVAHVEPWASNELALGFDLGSERSRRKAIEQAVQTGLMTCTDPVALLRDVEPSQGILVFRPVLARDGSSTPHGSEGMPAGTLRGLALGVIRLQSMLKDTLRQSDDSAPLIAAHLVNLASAEGPTLLASQPNQDAHADDTCIQRGQLHQRLHRQVHPVFVFGRPFAVITHPTPAFYAAYPIRTSWLAGLFGLFLTAVLVVLVGVLRNRHTHLEQQVQQRTLQLCESERRFRQMAVQAEAASLAKSEFLANVSHEIRTPMTAILGYADLIDDGCVGHCNFGRCQIPEAVTTIQRNGSHLLGLINDILDLSKIEAGQMPTEQLACSPHQITAEVASLVRVRAEAKNLEFYIEFIGPIPEVIRTDPLRLRQILVNLLGNAIKFTESGGVRLLVRLVRDEGVARLQFDVVDTGIGMTPEQTGCIFHPFSQADASTTRQFGGTGLGLAISKRLALLLGGDVLLVETEPGLGTRFRATVAVGPLEGVRMIEGAGNEDAVTLRQDSHGTAPALTDREKPFEDVRILLVEDGPDNQRLIAHLLKKGGADVVLADNGRIGLDLALAASRTGKPFNVVLMDMQMPVMDGYEATAALRDAGYSWPIIALTAHAMASDRAKCLEAGCNDYASKPIDRARLFEIIQRHLVATPERVPATAGSAR